MKTQVHVGRVNRRLIQVIDEGEHKGHLPTDILVIACHGNDGVESVDVWVLVAIAHERTKSIQHRRFALLLILDATGFAENRRGAVVLAQVHIRIPDAEHGAALALVG